MVTFLLVLILAVVLLYSIVLLKNYRRISAKELKRKAREGDELANALYRVVGYGMSLDILLWFLIGISGGLLFTLLADHVPAVWAVIGITAIIWLGFAWLPNSYGTYFGSQLARFTARPLHWVLDALYPLLVRVERFITKHRPVSFHTGLYTKDDLLELLSRQNGQLDNRITKDELIMTKNALTFGQQLVADTLTPRRSMKTVSVTDSVGPVLMEELHKSGHSRFPVYEGNEDNFVGVLMVRDTIKARSGGSVKSLMNKKVYFIHDESTLSEALQAFIKTHHHLFLVVNSFEEVVGLITMEDVIEQIIGKPIMDEFDQYDDMRAVASKAAKKEHTAEHIGEPSSKDKDKTNQEDEKTD